MRFNISGDADFISSILRYSMPVESNNNVNKRNREEKGSKIVNCLVYGQSQ